MMTKTTNHAKSDTFQGMQSTLYCPACDSVGEIGLDMSNDESRGNALIYRYYCQSCRQSTRWFNSATKASSAWATFCKTYRKETKNE